METFELCGYVEGILPALTPRNNENQNGPVERQQEYRVERGQAMHLFENTVYNEAFEIWRSYGYDLENRNPNILTDTLSEVFIKTITNSNKGIKA